MKKLALLIVLAAIVAFLPSAYALSCVPHEGQTGCFVTIGGQDLSDYDCDCVPETGNLDNCPNDFNPYQEDFDHDGIGDACEIVPPQNTPPVWAAFELPQLSCEGRVTIDIKQYVSDAQDSDSQLDYIARTSNQYVRVYEIGHGIFTIEHSSSSDESATITFTAEDTGGMSARATKTVHVDCAENQDPRLRLPDVDVRCGVNVDLDMDDYVDDEHISTLQYRLIRNSNPAIIDTSVYDSHVSLQSQNQNGYSDVTVRVTDDAGLYDEDTMRVSVHDCVENHAPIWDSFGLPSLQCGATMTYDVKPFVHDEDADTDLDFTAISNNPGVLVDEVTHGAFRIRHTSLQDEEVTITFVSRDTQGLSSQVSKSFDVVGCVQNQPPRLALDDLQLSCESTQQIDLRDFVQDEHGESVTFRHVSNSNPSLVAVSVSGSIATFRSYGVNGYADVTLRATDAEGLSDEDTMRVKVADCQANQPPVWASFSLPQLACQGSITFDARSYVSDDHDSDEQLDIIASSNNPDVDVFEADHGVFRIQHASTSDETATITFTATDREGRSASVTKSLTINCDENQAPRLTLDDLALSCSDTAHIDLRDFVQDESIETVTFRHVSNSNPSLVAVSVSGSIATFRSYGVNGYADVTLRATDDEGLSHEDTMRVRVSDCEGNHPPVLQIPDQKLRCEESKDIDLRQYTDDEDPATVSYSIEGTSGIVSVRIQNQRTLRITSLGEDGTANIRVVATDEEGLQGFDNVLITVRGCEGPNDAPELNIPDQQLSCDEEDTLNLRDYADDEDVESLIFSVESVNPSGVISTRLSGASLTLRSLGEDGTARVNIAVVDNQGLRGSDTFSVTVTGCEGENQPPRFEDIPGQTIECDESFDEIDLKDYVSDPDNRIGELTFTVSGGNAIGVDIDMGVVHLTNPEEDATETFTFKATDPHGAFDTASATFRVKNCEDDDEDEGPRFKAIPDQTVCYGEQFDDFDLDKYVIDGEGDLDFSADADDLEVDITSGNRVTIDYPRGFMSAENVKFTVRDENNDKDTQSVRFRVEDCAGRDHGYYVDEYVPTIIFEEFRPEPEPNTQCTLYDRVTRRQLPDLDCDQVPDDHDNCPAVPNKNQKDVNQNGIGDACDLALDLFTIAPVTVPAGESFTVKGIIRNKYGRDLEDIKVRAYIESLGITEMINIDSLKDGESEELDFTLTIPECTTAKDYVVKLQGEYKSRDIIYQSGKIKVTAGRCSETQGNMNIVDSYNIQDIPPGGTAIFPFKITNADPEQKAYVVRLVGVDGWGTYTLDTGSVVIVKPYGERVVNALVTANPDAPAGERTFMAEIRQGDEVQQIVLVASVKAQEKRSTVFNLILILEYLLAALIIIALVLGISYYVQKKRIERAIANS